MGLVSLSRQELLIGNSVLDKEILLYIFFIVRNCIKRRSASGGYSDAFSLMSIDYISLAIDLEEIWAQKFS